MFEPQFFEKLRWLKKVNEDNQYFVVCQYDLFIENHEGNLQSFKSTIPSEECGEMAMVVIYEDNIIAFGIAEEININGRSDGWVNVNPKPKYKGLIHSILSYIGSMVENIGDSEKKEIVKQVLSHIPFPFSPEGLDEIYRSVEAGASEGSIEVFIKVTEDMEVVGPFEYREYLANTAEAGARRVLNWKMLGYLSASPKFQNFLK